MNTSGLGLRCARGRCHSRQKIQNGACKYVVLVARYHMARICDIDKLGMRNDLGELPRRFDRHEVAVAAADKGASVFSGNVPPFGGVRVRGCLAAFACR